MFELLLGALVLTAIALALRESEGDGQDDQFLHDLEYSAHREVSVYDEVVNAIAPFRPGHQIGLPTESSFDPAPYVEEEYAARRRAHHAHSRSASRSSHDAAPSYESKTFYLPIPSSELTPAE